MAVGIGMDKAAVSEQDRESHRMAFLGLEVVAGFCVACLFTLALMPTPFNIREKLATCVFSIALPMVVWARIAMEGEGGAHVWRITVNLRILAHTLAILGFGILLSAVYWPASVMYGIATIWSPIAWSRAKRKADQTAPVATPQPDSVAQETSTPNTPPHSSGENLC
jgi:hypothetical protein